MAQTLASCIEEAVTRGYEAAGATPPPETGPGPHGWAVTQKPPAEGFKWSFVAQVATLLALVGMGWQAHSFVASLEKEHAEIRDSMDALYAGLQDVRRAVHVLTLRKGL